MYLVTEGKRKENQLGYSPKTKEYVYYHQGKEIWRMVGEKNLLEYFNEIRAGRMFEEDDIKTHPVWERYCKSCSELN